MSAEELERLKTANAALLEANRKTGLFGNLLAAAATGFEHHTAPSKRIQKELVEYGLHETTEVQDAVSAALRNMREAAKNCTEHRSKFVQYFEWIAGLTINCRGNRGRWASQSLLRKDVSDIFLAQGGFVPEWKETADKIFDALDANKVGYILVGQGNGPDGMSEGVLNDWASDLNDDRLNHLIRSNAGQRLDKHDFSASLCSQLLMIPDEEESPEEMLSMNIAVLQYWFLRDTSVYQKCIKIDRYGDPEETFGDAQASQCTAYLGHLYESTAQAKETREEEMRDSFRRVCEDPAQGLTKAAFKGFLEKTLFGEEASEDDILGPEDSLLMEMVSNTDELAIFLGEGDDRDTNNAELVSKIRTAISETAQPSGLSLIDTFVEFVFRFLDRDKDGSVDEEEFLVATSSFGSGGLMLSQFVISIFNFLDQDGDGKLTDTEINSVVKEVAEMITTLAQAALKSLESMTVAEDGFYKSVVVKQALFNELGQDGYVFKDHVKVTWTEGFEDYEDEDDDDDDDELFTRMRRFYATTVVPALESAFEAELASEEVCSEETFIKRMTISMFTILRDPAFAEFVYKFIKENISAADDIPDNEFVKRMAALPLLNNAATEAFNDLSKHCREESNHCDQLFAALFRLMAPDGKMTQRRIQTFIHLFEKPSQKFDEFWALADTKGEGKIGQEEALAFADRAISCVFRLLHFFVQIFRNAASNGLQTVAGNLVKGYGKDGLTLSQLQQLIGDTAKVLDGSTRYEQVFYDLAGKVLGSSKFARWWCSTQR